MILGLFSKDITIIEELEKRLSENKTIVLHTIDDVIAMDYQILIADYDTVSHELNILHNYNKLPEKVVVLESVPALATGKLLIRDGILAYGNIRMLSSHLNQLIDAVSNNKVWVYPELMSSVIKILEEEEALDETLMQRLTAKEQEAVKLVLLGLTNDALASKLNITERTVKAHLTSIFSKLHVNDRLGLVLLLKS